MLELSGDALTIIGILVAVIVALAILLIQLRSNRPKLVGSGSKSGSINVPNEDIVASAVSIKNEPTFLGMRMDRGLVKIQSATIYDPALKEFVGPPLRWQIEGSNELEGTCEIAAGQSRSLYVFAKKRYEVEFFVYAAPRLDSEVQRGIAIYDGRKRDFTIHLHDVIGHSYRFEISVRNTEQSVHVRFKITWGARLQMLRDAVGMVVRAFSPG